MTRAGSFGRLGVDLGNIGEQPVAERIPECPGARLRVTRHDFDALVQGGELFETARQDVKSDGYSDARVRCSQPVGQMPMTASRSVLFYGLCHSCSALEAQNRFDLRERARIKGDR